MGLRVTGPGIERLLELAYGLIGFALLIQSGSQVIVGKIVRRCDTKRVTKEMLTIFPPTKLFSSHDEASQRSGSR